MLSFIHAAAAEQDPEAKIEATEDKLRSTLHLEDDGAVAGKAGGGTSAARFAYALVIVAPEGEVAGHAIYTYNYSAWRAMGGFYLDELYVARAYRRRGYGRLLIGALAAEARRAGCGKLEWNCYRDNERALRFYDSLGAKRKDSWVVLQVIGEPFDKLAAAA